MATSDTVRVEFVDAETGETFAGTAMPADRMPETFAIATTLQLEDEPWIVERAVPPTRGEFVAAGLLTLTVRRVMTMAPENILYSLPTIADELPGVTSRPGPGLAMNEDDWRQIELVSAGRLDAAGDELVVIDEVYEEHAHRDAAGDVTGFRQIHVRPDATYVEPVPQTRVRALLPAHVRDLGGVRFHDAPGLADGTFAWSAGGLTVYGTGADVTVLGLHFSPDDGPVDAAWLEPLLRELDLVIVDWCGCTVARPDELATYLGALGVL